MLYSFGNNDDQELGFVSENSSIYIPTLVNDDTDWYLLSTGLDTGYTHSLGLKGNGELWGWGNNYEGCIGTANQETKPVMILE